ncbi:hypothetical protein [Fodinibius sp.]|uniref:hypothetical protein n=1 Tax=Fodinibius sp. TaxID=1872440 RepID=UPI002ACDE392|nr:hypothetical protein [Fodinibius sp.]MDZ7659140.1 hypothetical protein [Fodinibius sp.]
MGDDDHPIIVFAIFDSKPKLGIANILFDWSSFLNVDAGKAENIIKSEPHVDAAIAYNCSSCFM